MARFRSIWGLAIVSLITLVPSGYWPSRVSAAVDRSTLATGWQRHTVTVQANALGSVYAGNSTFLALAPHGALSSKDGITWRHVPGSVLTYAQTLHISDLNLARAGMNGILPGETASVKAIGPNGSLVAVGSYHAMGTLMTTTRADIALSLDGRAWHTVSSKKAPFADAAVTDVSGDGNHWVAVGYRVGAVSRPLIWTSPDTTHWQRASHPPAPAGNEELDGVLHGPTGFLASASGLDGPAGVWMSADGTRWIGGTSAFRGAIIRQITVGGPGYLAVGVQDDVPALWSSADGIHWQRRAGSSTFRGGDTSLQGIAATPQRIVAVGWYARVTPSQWGAHFGPRQTSSWVWTPARAASSLPPHPSAADARTLHLQLSDLPFGYVEAQFGGWADLCDDGSTLCRAVNATVGPFDAYQVGYESTGRTRVQVQSMTIVGTHVGPGVLAALGPRLAQWSNRAEAFALVATRAHIGDETRVYRGAPLATSVPPGGRLTAYAVEWRRRTAIGQVYVEEPPSVPPNAVEGFALTLARRQLQHLTR